MPFKRSFIFFLFIIFVQAATAQPLFNGNVFDRKNKQPLSNVSISIGKKKGGFLSDKNGHFAFSTGSLRKTDTLTLSSIGYSTLKIPLADAIEIKDFFLLEES
jgi:hypothetical protein